MISPTQTRDIIEERIFVPLGMTAIYAPLIGTSVDIYGDNVSSSMYGSSSNLTVVPANYVNTNQVFFDFGNVEKGSQDLIIRPTSSTVNIGDKVIYLNTPYMVKALKDYVLSDTSIFIALRCVEFI
jgi:hypothetical protein